jgi:ABC-type oligopeptide transport system substrate-binding subunit
MNYSRNSIVTVAALAAALALSACGKQEAPPPKPAETAPAPAPATPPPPATPAAPTTTVSSLVLGNSLGGDGKVVAPATTFAPKDTIYAQVVTTSTGGSGSVSVMAKWTFGDGQPVSQSTESVSTAAGTATTTFHISKPDGWPTGKYEVQISIDGKPVTNAAFDVK